MNTILSTGCRLAQRACSIVYVVLMCTPLKIYSRVIDFTFVNVVNFNEFFWISVLDERKRNETVHEELIQLIVLAEMCYQVATVIELRLQYVLLIKTQGTYMTEIADFIQFFKSLDWLPYFFYSLLHITVPP